MTLIGPSSYTSRDPVTANVSLSSTTIVTRVISALSESVVALTTTSNSKADAYIY
jgi:hypothetical protein